VNVLCIQHNERDGDRTRRELARLAPGVVLEIVPTLVAARARLAAPHGHDIVIADLDAPADLASELLVAIREQSLPLPMLAVRGAERVVAAARTLAGFAAPAPEGAIEAKLLDAAPVIVLVLDPQGTIRHINPYFERLSGYGLDEVRGKEWFGSFLPQRDRDEIRQLFHAAVSDTPTRGHVNPIVTRDGEERDIEWHDQTMRDSAGNVTALLVIGQDVTERRRAEQRLRDTSDRLAAMLLAVPDLLFEIDADGRILDYRARRTDLLYLPPEAFMDRLVEEILPPDAAAVLLSAIQEAASAGESFGKQYQLSMPGGVNWYELSVARKAPEGAAAPTFICLVRDVTDRAVAERRLRQSEQRLQTIIDSMYAFVAVYALDGSVLEVNRAPLEAAGLRREDVIGRPFWTTPFFSHSAAVQDQVRSALSRAAAGDAVREDIQTRLGSDVFTTIDATFGPIRDEEGHIVQVIGSGVDISDRLRAEDALRASEERYRGLVEYSPVGIYVHDGETILFSNQGFADILGAASPADVVGRTLTSIVHPGDHARLRDRVESLRGGLTVNPLFEGRIVRLDGDVRYGQVTAMSCTFDGKPAIQVLLVDVTEQHTAVAAIRERDAALIAGATRLAEAQRLARMGSWELDLVTNGLTWSDEIFRIFEIEKERFGASYEAFLNAIHPDDRALVDFAYQGSVAARQPYEVTHRLLMVDGRIKYVQERGETYYGPGGEPLRSVGTVQDITERRLTEQSLRLLSTGVVHLNGEAFFAEISTRMAELLGVEIGFVNCVVPGDRRRVRTLGMSVDSAQAPNGERDIVGTACESTGADGCIYTENAGRLFPADRQIAEFGVSAYASIPLFDSAGELTGHIGVMSRRPFQHPDRIEATLRLFAVRAGAEIERMRAEDERRALEAQLRQSQKMQAIGTLAGGIAHDFNNILSAIMGNTDLLAMELEREHPAAPAIGEIRKASSRAKDLVAQILTFSSQREQPRGVISLRPIADEVVKLLRVALPAQVELARAFQQEAPTVLADPTQMHQLMMNLCTNAWQSLEGAPGRIEIRLESVTLDDAATRTLPGLQPGPHARLVVSDTGEGMDADTMERIFEPFFTTKGVGKGTGLGLAVAHGIVTAHGGAIVVRSAPGAGSTFEAYLPAQTAAVVVPVPAEAEPTRGLGQHIVYVDDEAALVRLTERLLQRGGYRTTGFTDPVLALDAIRAEPEKFDALLTDLNMPGMSGFDLIRQVRLVRPDMPVALTTGFPTDEMQVTADALGCREILIKPARSEDLARLFERLFAAAATDRASDA